MTAWRTCMSSLFESTSSKRKDERLMINRTIALLAIVLGFAGVTVPDARGAEEKHIKALLVIGGCCHDYEKQKDILTQGISDRSPVEWTVSYDPDTSTKHLNPIYAKAAW